MNRQPRLWRNPCAKASIFEMTGSLYLVASAALRCESHAVILAASSGTCAPAKEFVACTHCSACELQLGNLLHLTWQRFQVRWAVQVKLALFRRQAAHANKQNTKKNGMPSLKGCCIVLCAQAAVGKFIPL